MHGGNMALKLSVPPEAEPITLEEAKLHCKVEVDDDDDLIEALITAAREYCEGFQRRAYITQTWELWLDSFPSTPLTLPLPPLQSVDSIKYYDTDNIETEFEEYYVDTNSEPGRLELNYGESWPTVILRDINSVCITFTAGYGGAGDVPQKVKQAILLIVSAWYENRENFISTGAMPKDIPLGAASLLWMDRCF
jgi:uncharacterized phiE125 gp8 family phage protein